MKIGGSVAVFSDFNGTVLKNDFNSEVNKVEKECHTTTKLDLKGLAWFWVKLCQKLLQLIN